MTFPDQTEREREGRGEDIMLHRLDRAPDSLNEREYRRALLKEQIRQASPADSVIVSCASCPRNNPVTKSYRCLYCGFWLCRTCAERHFADEKVKS